MNFFLQGFSAGLFYHDKDGNPLTSIFADGLPLFNYSVGLSQQSDKVVPKVERFWDIYDNKWILHTVYLIVMDHVVNETQKQLSNSGGNGTWKSWWYGHWA